MTTSDATLGGQGDDPTRSDLQLDAQALREEWPIGAEARARILTRALWLVERDDNRTAIAAMRVIIAAGGLNIAQQSLDVKRAELARQHPAEEAADDDDDFVLDLHTGAKNAAPNSD